MNRSQRRRREAMQPKPLRRKERWTPLQRATPVPFTEHQIAEHIAYATKHGMTEEQARATIADLANDEMWKNDRYQVSVHHLDRDEGAVPMVQLSIRRVDRQPVHDWRDLQRIKNELVGPECEAVELYPAESRLVDTANQYFLWAVLDPSFRFPCGFGQRLVSEETSGGSVQRPFEE
jgi:hypothetical protein